MPNVESFQITGCRCWFYSDDHSPAHFHASSPGEWEVRVYFLLEPPQMEVVLDVKRVPSQFEELCYVWRRNTERTFSKSGARKSTAVERSDGQVVRV